MSQNEKEKKKKKQKSIIEAEIMSIIEKSLKKTVDMALDEILKDFK